MSAGNGAQFVLFDGKDILQAAQGCSNKNSIKGSWDLSKNILKQGVGKSKSCSQGKGVLKVSPPLPLPPGKF